MLLLSAYLETTDVSYGWRGTCISGKLDALPGGPAIATITFTPPATTSSCATIPNISRLVHAVHPAFVVFSHLTWAVITSQAVAIIAAITPLFFPPDDDDDDDGRRSFGFYMMPARDGKI